MEDPGASRKIAANSGKLLAFRPVSSTRRHSVKKTNGTASAMVPVFSSLSAVVNCSNCNALRYGAWLLNLDLGELRDQAAGPHINVMFLDDAPHALHPRTLLLKRHLEAYPDRLCQLLNIVRIHQKRIPELARRARKAAENQHSALVVARGHKLLGHQVHAVVQRSDHAKIGRPIQPLDLPVAMLLVEVHDRLPRTGLKTPVDSFGLRLHFRLEIVIPLDVGPARSANLHKAELPLVQGIFF